MGSWTPPLPLIEPDKTTYVNDLNSFYARFDTHDFSNEISKAKFECQSAISECDVQKIVVTESDVRRVFSRLNTSKACGPDGVKGRVLKLCCEQLSYVFCKFYNFSLNNSVLPSSWLLSEIIPVPKSKTVKEMNDLRPVALTSVIMKCFERIILKEIKLCFTPSQDGLQFAYRSGRSVDDAISLFLDNVYSHLDKPRTYCRILFVDFSSAFNTIQPHILVNKLNDLKMNMYLISWILEFLTNRTQYVNFCNSRSGVITTNTGAPQGCVVSPVLFTIYTNDCSINTNSTKLIKFADDSTIQGLIQNDDEREYFDYINLFTNWCDEHFLLLNVKKTKELVIDFRVKKEPLLPISIKGENVTIVNQYKYLGIIIDDKLEWDAHSSSVHSKMQQRLFFLRKLNAFNIDCKILYLFYSSVIESILLFCFHAWGGNIKADQQSCLQSTIKKCLSICGVDFYSINTLLDKVTNVKINRVLKDRSHPLFSRVLFSKRRQGRLLSIKTKTERHRKSFLPRSVRKYIEI